MQNTTHGKDQFSNIKQCNNRYKKLFIVVENKFKSGLLWVVATLFTTMITIRIIIDPMAIKLIIHLFTAHEPYIAPSSKTQCIQDWARHLPFTSCAG